MQITFKEDFSFAEDGINQRLFRAGETHEVSQSCADSAAQVGVVANDPTSEEPVAEEPTNSTKLRPGRKAKPNEE